MGITGVTLPRDPIQEQPTYDGALAAFEKQKPVRILFDNGAGGSSSRRPAARASSTRSPGFPVPGTEGAVVVLRAGRRAGRRAGDPQRADAFTMGRARASAHRTSPATRRRATNGLWTATPPYQWAQQPEGHRGVLREQAARRRTRPSLGAGAVRAWVRSSKRRTSTCRRRSPRSAPTARRRSCRAAGCAATSASSTRRRARPLEPVLSLRKRDVRPLPRTALRPGHDPALLRGPRLPGRARESA